MAKAAKVAILMGSDSDWPIMEQCYTTLREFDVPTAVRVISAHRTPERLREFMTSSDQEQVAVFIAAAGMAAALPGAVASYTDRPVIGVPLATEPLKGVDSLLSIVQMPPGMPVATVTVGKAGAKNAALLAVQMLAVADSRLRDAFKIFKRNQAETVDKKDQDLQERLGLA
jgi:5-(carboxyamino)imidazole ribonucleotide mutase